MTTQIPIGKVKEAAGSPRKPADAGGPAVFGSELLESDCMEMPEDEPERLLSEADHDIAAGRVSLAKDGLSAIRQAYGL